MTDYSTVSIDTETGCGREFVDWPVSFRVHWEYDYDTGWNVETRFYRAHIGNLEVNRETAIKVFGEATVRTMESDAATDILENKHDHLELAE